VSADVAAQLTRGFTPKGRAVSLQAGGLSALEPGDAFRLILQRDGKGHILAGGTAFFNFLLGLWMPLSRLPAYVPSRKVLYCAFCPQKSPICESSAPLLLVKLGFRSLGELEEDSLIRYVEKKTRVLRLTNVPGAGLFVLPPPESHRSLEDPARAAEESLKAALLGSPELRAVPSGHRAEVATFSSSLEYLWVAARRPGFAPLQALTGALRDFSGDATLEPRRAFASDLREAASALYRRRGGRKRLVQWCPEADGAFDPDVAPASASRQPLDDSALSHPAIYASLPLASALRSRGFAARRAPLRRRSGFRSLSLPALKWRRKACSAP